jgi:hypothetical protein
MLLTAQRCGARARLHVLRWFSPRLLVGGQTIVTPMIRRAASAAATAIARMTRLTLGQLATQDCGKLVARLSSTAERGRRAGHV